MERAGNAAILPADPLITDHHFPGGVAERLIAPVLKTGRPKGLVSTNLTPSASSSSREKRRTLNAQRPTSNSETRLDVVRSALGVRCCFVTLLAQLRISE